MLRERQRRRTVSYLRSAWRGCWCCAAAGRPSGSPPRAAWLRPRPWCWRWRCSSSSWSRWWPETAGSCSTGPASRSEPPRPPTGRRPGEAESEVFDVGSERESKRSFVYSPPANLVVLIDGVEDDQCGVAGDLELGVGDGRSVVHQHHDVFGLGADGGHVHWSAGTQTDWDQTLQNTQRQ